MNRTSLQLVAAVALSATASALPLQSGRMIVEASTTVAQANPSGTSPFLGIAVGDAVLVHYEVLFPGTDLVPGQFTNFAIDPAASFVSIGGVTEFVTGGQIGIVNDFPVADSIRGGGPMAVGGGTLTLEVSDPSGTIFSSTDVSMASGVYPSTTWGSFFHGIFGGGNFIEFDLPEVTIQVPSNGTAFCNALPNSTGTAGTLIATGSDVAADNDVTLTTGSLPPGQFGIFVVSRTIGPAVLVGDGNLCLTGPTGRFTQPGQILQADAAGSFSLALDLNQIPTPTTFVSAQAGDTFYFQAWHRDGTVTAPTSNFTAGVEITFS